jgi:hypothetical protein
MEQLIENLRVSLSFLRSGKSIFNILQKFLLQ